MAVCDILEYGMNLKLEIIVQTFIKIIKLNWVNKLKTSIEYYKKQI